MPTRVAGIAIPREDLYGAVLAGPTDYMTAADRVFTPCPVPSTTGYIAKVTRQSTMSLPPVKRAPGGGYKRSAMEIDNIQYSTQEYGQEEALDDKRAKQYLRYLDYERTVAIRLRDIIRRNYENRVLSALQSTTNFPTSGNTGVSVTNKWSSASNATVFADVLTGKKSMRDATGFLPNVMVIGWKTWGDISKTDDMLQRLKYSGTPGANIPLKALADALGLEEVIVCDGMYDGANEGATAAPTNFWDPQYAFLCRRARSENPEEACIGRTLYWAADSGIETVEEYRDETVRANVLRVRQEVDERFILQELGFLFVNIN